MNLTDVRDTHVVDMLLVDFIDTSVGGADKHHGMFFEELPHMVAKERVLAQLGSYDHASATKKLIGRQSLCWIRICKLLCKN